MSSPSDFPISSELSEDKKLSTDDVLLALNAIPSSPLTPSKATSLTGAYPSRGGGGVLFQSDASSSKLVQVICLHKGNTLPLCLGLIGVQKNSFCLKTKELCSVSAHSNSTFEPELDNYFICKSYHSDAAWCEFTFPISAVSNLRSQGVDFSSRKSHEDWKLIFLLHRYSKNPS